MKFMETDLDNEFYSVILDNVSKRGEAINRVQELHIHDIDGRFLVGLHKFDTTIKAIFPNLKRLRLKTLLAVSPVIVQRLSHASLEELSIEPPEGGRHPIPFIGEPVSFGQLFSDSFSKLTCLVFKELIMGNIRIDSILQNLKKHQHLKSVW
nr:uncharacterized protein LOC129268843 [Lytechinus pictus]